LLQELRLFIVNYMGFGDFVFRMPDRSVVGRAKDVRDLAEQLEVIPKESVSYHAARNHFSKWLKARTEHPIATRMRVHNFSNYSSFAEGKEAHVLEFFASKKERARDFASDGFIKDSLQMYSVATDKIERENISDTLTKHLLVNKKPLDADILDVHILDENGIIISATRGEEKGSDESNELYFRQSLERVYIDDARKHEGHREEILFAVGAPIKSRTSNRVIGVLMNSYSLSNVEDFISGARAKELGAPTTIETLGSLDIFLANEEGKMIIPSKKMKHFGNLEHNMGNHEAVHACIVNGEEINKEWEDGFGTEVFGASMCPQIEEDWKWALVVEREGSELLMPVQKLKYLSFTVVFITLILAALVALIIAKSISDPIKNLTTIAESISKGKLDVKIKELDGNDEIGALSRAFERIMVSMKIAMSSKGETRGISKKQRDGGNNRSAYEQN